MLAYGLLLIAHKLTRNLDRIYRIVNRYKVESSDRIVNKLIKSIILCIFFVAFDIMELCTLYNVPCTVYIVLGLLYSVQ